MIGKKILNYKIIRQIGEGGMARVYQAEHVKLGKQVAIKILNQEIASRENFRKRFESEARIMAELNHSNIVQVLDYVEIAENNTYAIIMELLEGESLSDLINKNGALTEQLTYDLMLKILSAFEYAHQKGLVHRDIKPSNIYIMPDKNIKILDFGIAKILDMNMELTSTGMIMGTPMYMSPEQVKDVKYIDKRSDIYSLGVMIYYMLTGKPPYNSSYEITYKIVTEPLPLLHEHKELSYIIQKATKKEPQERYQSCVEIIEDLSKNISIIGNHIDKEVSFKKDLKNVADKTINKDIFYKYDLKNLNRRLEAEDSEEEESDDEKELWNAACFTGSFKSYQKYFEKYPSGKYAEEAKRRIKG